MEFAVLEPFIPRGMDSAKTMIENFNCDGTLRLGEAQGKIPLKIEIQPQSNKAEAIVTGGWKEVPFRETEKT